MSDRATEIRFGGGFNLSVARAKQYESDLSKHDECVIEEQSGILLHSLRSSVEKFFNLTLPNPPYTLVGAHCSFSWPKDGGRLYRRSSTVKGPLAVFGYDYFADHAKAAGVETPKLLSYEGLWGGGEEYAYEVLNFTDGKRNAEEIRDAVSAEYGPVPLEMVVEYLKALEKIGIVEAVK